MLAIVAYLQPVSRPEIARIRGVASDSAVGTLTERGLIEESGRSQFGAVTYATTPLFEKLFGLAGLDALPDPARFDPTPEDERQLRERLLKAGEQRSGVDVRVRGGGDVAGLGAGACPPGDQNHPIPFPQKRKNEMAAYSKRHYGDNTYVLSAPKVIVEHVAVAPSLQSIFNIFAPDHPDPELHELPNVCSHFAVGPTGKIWQFVPLNIRCRHTVGLNYTAIGIEHVGFSDADILGRPPQLKASLGLTHYLMCRFGISINVIGHNESLSSPYHKELVPALKNQTHGDWKHASMPRSTAA